MVVDTEKIELSVIISTYNRAEQLRACLDSLSRQIQPVSDWEVVVVVDGSTDDTSEMLSNLATPYRLQVYAQEHLGKGAALNRGVAVASGRYCLFLDDNVVAEPNLAAKHLRAHRAGQRVLGVGQITFKVSPRADWYARQFADQRTRHYAELSQGLQSPSWLDCNTGNLSAPRTAVIEVGGFAIDLPVSFDLKLGYDLEGRGLHVEYVAGAIVKRHEDGDFDRLIAEAEQRGQVHAELGRRYPEMSPGLLGDFVEATLRTLFLRRFLLKFNVPPRLLRAMGRVNQRKWRADWFKFIHDYSYWRGVRHATPDNKTWQRLTNGTPILMYHAFGQPGEPPSRFILPAQRFARQMAWLKWMRYHVLSLEEFLCYRREYRLLPTHSVIITVDDGYADNYSAAYPILRRYGFPATIFLVSSSVGDMNRWDKQGLLVGRPLMSWGEIREMMCGGITFGAHTRTHPMLTAVPPERAKDEIESSRVELERELGVPAQLFCYPHGKYDATSRSFVEQAGFSGACSTRAGLNTPATSDFELRRSEIRGTDSFVRFVLGLWLGDNHLPPRRK